MKRLLLFLICGLLWTSAHAATRCNGHLIMIGDSAAEVREHCGVPYFVDRYAEDAVVRNHDGRARGFTPIYDAWYYNFGPQRLLQRLLFSSDTLQKEETLGSYGFNGSGPCDFGKITDNMSSGEVFARCGPPAAPASVIDPSVDMGDVGYLPIWIQQWAYPRDGTPTHVVHLVNGRVQSVETVK